MSSNTLRRLFRVALPVLLLLCFINFAAASSSPPSAAEASPSAKAELICHTDNPAECYPKVFSPTEEFQIVHDDQELPSGLHVRMNIWTGEKEARLNTPMPDDPALEGLPVEQSVVVVDPEPAEEQQPRIPAGAPVYEPVGKVKEPEVQDPDFAAALDYIKKNAETALSDAKNPLDDALVDLEDLSHDMYYGKKIIEDADVVKALLCLLTQRDLQQVKDRPYSERRDFLASSTLSSSLQNNVPALRDMEANWDSIMNSQCAFHERPLKDILFSDLEGKTRATDGASVDEAHMATWVRTVVPVVGRLLKSDQIRPQFMESDGMQHLLKILLVGTEGGKDWSPVQQRIARIVSDTFLDDTVGAELGLWPLQPVHDASTCQEEATRLDDGCWEHHLRQIIQHREGDVDWARDLLAMLKSVRPGSDTRKDEL